MGGPPAERRGADRAPHQTQGIDRRKIMPIRPRFVRTDRSGTLDPKDLEPKSRLVIPGHFTHKMRKTLGLKVRVDAPVAPHCALHLLLAITSTMQWVLTKFDVEAAFLTGKDIDEEVYFSLRAKGFVGFRLGRF